MAEKKYLITGALGFVAPYFIACLKKHEKNAVILGVDIVENETDIDINYLTLDLTNTAQVERLINEFQPDYIVHLAGMSSVAKSWKNPAECVLTNTTAFLNLVESVRKFNLETRILSVGSAEEYGIYDIPVKEYFHLHPKNPYSVARVEQEYLAKLYVDHYDMDIVMTRSFNHIGPKQKTTFVIPSFVTQLVRMKELQTDNRLYVGNTEVVRDFLDVRDVAEAYYQILKQGERREVYNVCSGEGIKLLSVIKMICQKLNVAPELIVDTTRLRSNEIMYLVGDNSKLKEELGWQKSIPLSKTISDMIESVENDEKTALYRSQLS